MTLRLVHLKRESSPEEMESTVLQVVEGEIRRRIGAQHEELQELTQSYTETFAKWEHSSVQLQEAALAVEQRLAEVEESMTEGTAEGCLKTELEEEHQHLLRKRQEIQARQKAMSDAAFRR